MRVQLIYPRIDDLSYYEIYGVKDGGYFDTLITDAMFLIYRNRWEWIPAEACIPYDGGNENGRHHYV